MASTQSRPAARRHGVPGVPSTPRCADVFPQVIPRPAKTVSDHRIARAAVRLALALGVVGVVGAGDEAAAREQWRRDRLRPAGTPQQSGRHRLGGKSLAARRRRACRGAKGWPCSSIAASIPIRSWTSVGRGPLRAAFEKIARSRGLGVSLLGPVLFMGPPEAAARLRTLAALREEDVRRLPAAAAGEVTRTEVHDLGRSGHAARTDGRTGRRKRREMAGLELVPHDLWAAADLPPLSWTDRLTLVAIQFDLTFAISADGTAVRLAPLPERVAMVRSYPGGADPEATARKFAALAPGAEIKLAAGQVYVRGLVEDQERITQPRHAADAAEAAGPPGPGRRSLHAHGERAAGRGAVGAARPQVETGTLD